MGVHLISMKGKSATSVPVGQRGEREAGILATAVTLFAARGHDKVSMAMVASAAGLSEGTLYNYFRDKRDLILRVGFIAFERRVAEAEQAIEHAASLRAGLEELIEIQLRTILDHEESFRIWLREVRAAEAYPDSQARGLFRRYTNLFVRLLERWGIEPGARFGLTPATMRDMVFGGAEHVAWTALVQHRGRDLDTVSMSADLASAYLRAFRLEDI
jgi:TetR/AcrR family transcriptional regulator, fatty acid metabolism regulator protein